MILLHEEEHSYEDLKKKSQKIIKSAKKLNELLYEIRKKTFYEQNKIFYCYYLNYKFS